MSPLQGFSGGSATSGFQAGQAMNVKGAFGGMLQDLVAEWKKQKGEERTFGMETQKTMGMEVFKQKLKEESPLYKSQTKAYEALALKRGTPDVGDTAKFKKQVWAQASSDAFKESGGSMWMGLGTKNKEYVDRRKELYGEYLKRFGFSDISIPTDVDEESMINGENDLLNEIW